jgi:tetratricopeptide (TPR) repeat protein
MFDAVPTRVWLLIAIAVAAFAPARYVYRYIAHSPSRTDITLPPADLSWRTSSHFVRSSMVLAGLVALALFIFTPVAERFARSPSFWSILIAAGGAWALFTVARGLVTGQIEPLAKGFYNTYKRETQPKRFWASMVWNAAFGSLLVWGAFEATIQAWAHPLEDRCYDRQTAYSPQEELSACNELISKRDATNDDFADLLAARGYAHHRSGDYQRALRDYSNAVRLDPENSYVLFNRGLIYDYLGDDERAAEDYSASIRLRPKNFNAYLYRGMIFLDSGKFDKAAADFSQAHALDAENPWALADRGLAYAWMNETTRAERDFEAVKRIDPSNQVVLRGEALLSLNAGNLEEAIRRLEIALKHESGDTWSLNMRAWVYRRLGEEEKAQADIAEALRLSKDRQQVQSTR